MKNVYKCEDYQVGNGILTIWGAKLIAQIETEEQFNTLTKVTNYDALICPELFHNREQFSMILFEE